MSELSKSSLLKVFKGYLSRLTASLTVKQCSVDDAIACLDLAFERCEILRREMELIYPKQLPTSKIDISGDLQKEAVEEMITLLNKLAEWQTLIPEECDEPHAARHCRSLLITYNLIRKD